MQDKESGRGASERQGVRDRSREGGDREKRRDDDYDRSSGREKARDMTGSRSSRDYDRERERDRERGRERDREREWEREGGRGSGRYDGRGGQRSRHQDRPGRDPEAGKDGDPTQNQGSKRGRGWDATPPTSGAPAAPPPPPKLDPAEMVRMMMAAPGAAAAGAAPAPTAALTLDQKKKLLWGSKKAEAAVSVAAPAQAASALQRGPAEAVYGANRWDVAEFSSEAEKAKFNKLMGVKGGAVQAPRPSGPAAPLHTAMDREKQERVLHDVEEAFTRGLAQTGAKKGLGADPLI